MRKAQQPSSRSFWRDATGVVAVEFGIAAVPFFMMLIGILEAGLMFFTATLLEGGVNDASRLVRTGQVIDDSNPEASFRAKLCEKLILVDCQKVVIEIRAFPSFAAAGEDRPNYRTTTNQSGTAGDLMPRPIQLGSASQVMVSRVQYRYPFLSPVGTLISGSTENSVPLLSTTVFKNEPYS